MAATPQPLPPLNIPDSNSTVNVHIIDTTSHLSNVPNKIFVVPEYKGFASFDSPAFSFLIEHPPTGQKYIFDLGVRKDVENLPPTIYGMLKDGDWSVTVEKNVVEILRDGGVDPKEINGIIWSHHHFDHTGDPSTFPPTTSLIVGPGFKEAILPGYPANPSAGILESDYRDRTLTEISFKDSRLMLGRFNALDFFDDGSFYLLDAPGHAVGHLCALCRTTAGPEPTFMYLGGDCAHHGGEIRPTQYLPLPEEISPSPIPHIHKGVCPGTLFSSVHRLHPSSSALTEPFFLAAEDMAVDVQQARESITKLGDFDAYGNVLTVLAHDTSLLNVVGTFPKESANGWKQKGWREKGLWRFLSDFGPTLEAENQIK